MFRSASWDRTIEPTGIRDQIASAGQPARDYGEGLVGQHWLALRRIAKRLSARRDGGGASTGGGATAV
jgi:hypothetical protein